MKNTTKDSGKRYFATAKEMDVGGGLMVRVGKGSGERAEEGKTMKKKEAERRVQSVHISLSLPTLVR